MPGRKGSHATPVPWKRAVSLAGSVERLTAGVKKKTWLGWEASGFVPAYRMLPFVLRAIETQAGDREAVPVPFEVEDLLAAAAPGMAIQADDLPEHAIKAYRVRAKEIEDRLRQHARLLRRELQEFREKLITEHRKQ